jgi:threonyl-tRNA synthetase
VFAVFSCIERDDTVKEVTDAVEEVCRVIKSIRSTRRIVIVPFVHLSEDIAPPEKAVVFLDTLKSQFLSRGFDACSISFGYHKTFELHFKAYGHPLAVAYRSFPRLQAKKNRFVWSTRS